MFKRIKTRGPVPDSADFDSHQTHFLGTYPPISTLHFFLVCISKTQRKYNSPLEISDLSQSMHDHLGGRSQEQRSSK